MKRLAATFFALAVIICLAYGSALKAEKVLQIGILQFVTHPALDSNRKGFVDGMAEAGYVEGKNVHYDIQNAQGEISNCYLIANKFVTDGKDLIVAIATPSAQAAAKATNTIPIILGTVTDPVAAGLADSWQRSGRNITGVASKAPMGKTIDLYLEITPNLKRLGVLYNPGEQNSVDEVKELEEAAKERGIEIIHATVPTSADVGVAANSLVGRVDAMTTPKDNTVVSGIAGAIKVAEQEHIPFFAMDTATVNKGAVAALGVDFYQLGKNAAKKAVRVIKGEKPANIPISMAEKFFIWINQKSAKQMGIVIPKEVIAKADKVLE
jgi:putative ABC transport system substrate-binding protein